MREYDLIRPRLEDDHPVATSCMVSAQVDKLSSDKFSGTPPGNAFGHEAEEGWPRGSIPLRRAPVMERDRGPGKEL